MNHIKTSDEIRQLELDSKNLEIGWRRIHKGGMLPAMKREVLVCTTNQMITTGFWIYQPAVGDIVWFQDNNGTFETIKATHWMPKPILPLTLEYPFYQYEEK